MAIHAMNDYPLHQTSSPLEIPVSGDPNVYDRFFFNGYNPAGSIYFGCAFGLYPNRGIQDASFSVVWGGYEQVSVHASGLIDDRAAPSIGPITIEIIQPMRVLRVIVAGEHHGLSADLTFTARTEAVVEPPFFVRSGVRTVMDYTRLTQWGTWSGWIQLDAERIELDTDVYRGSRDRSWGVRSLGERMPGPAPKEFQFFWLWAPVNFDDLCTHMDCNEYADGRRWHESGFLVTADDSTKRSFVEGAAAELSDWRIDWKPGTRWADHFAYDLAVTTHADGIATTEVHTVEMEPIVTFLMNGIGYMHPEWSHGHYKGKLAVGSSRWRLQDIDPSEFHRLHVQQLCRVTMGDRVGMGIVEILAIGPHSPSGFVDLASGWSAPADDQTETNANL
jgi:hypothetical protein